MSDVLIVGSGIAGLSLAIKLNKRFPDKKIVIITKEDGLQSNTRYAQGGISVVCDAVNDSFESHIEDTLEAGDGLCVREVVEKVIRFAPEALQELMDHGVVFDLDEDGDLALRREGGHSRSRVVHQKDMTGYAISVSLLEKIKNLPGIILLTHHIAIDLITDRQLGQPESKTCYGAFVLDKKSKFVHKFVSRLTVLATGGVGQVYSVSTNPEVATGDGIAMAQRAGAVIRNMEFVQFHPTAFFFHELGKPNFLITEAIRGYGAFLRNNSGKRFMYDYDAQGELACRDVVARAIESEIMSDGHPCVYLDCTHLPAEELIKDFPKIYQHCMENGIDISKNLIPVVPAAHYLCGGIEVNGSSRTSIHNLYALGECSYTGLHGANRLASNSLLEAITYAEFSFTDIQKQLEVQSGFPDLKNIDVKFVLEYKSGSEINLLREKIQYIMTKFAGIRRTNSGQVK